MLWKSWCLEFGQNFYAFQCRESLEILVANNCECNFRTLGLGAGNGRVVDREIQRESLLCPDYLKVPRQQQQLQYNFRLQKGKEGVRRERQMIMRESRWEEKDRTGKLIEIQKFI